MRKLIKWSGIGLAVLLLLVAGGLVLAPAFVDLEFVKEEAGTAVAEATGRPLYIDGEVSLALLPSPKLTITGLRYPNAEEGTPEPMLAIEAVSARLNWLPLLFGRVHVAELRVRKPELRLEVLPDGRGNWLMPSKAAPETSPPAGTGPAVKLDRIVVDAGHVSYRDAASGVEETLELLDATGQVADLLHGPYRLAARIRFHGEEISLTSDVGVLAAARPVAVDAAASGRDFKLAAKGELALARDDGEARLAVSGEGRDLARLLSLFGAPGLPPGLAQAFALQAEVRRTGTAVAVSPFEVRIGPSRATGRLGIDLGAAIAVDLKLDASELPLETYVPTAGDAATPTAPPQLPKRLGLPLPADLRAKLDLSMTGLSWHGRRIGDARIRGHLDDGRLTLDEVSATLPQRGHVHVAAQAATRDGALSFEGSIEAEAQIPTAEADRLGHGRLNARFEGGAEEIRLTDVVAHLDDTSATGSARLTLGPRPDLAVEARIDRVDLDRYLPTTGRNIAGGSPLPALRRALQGFEKPWPIAGLDGRLRLAFDEILYHGQSVKGGQLAASLRDRALQVETLTVADLAGGALKMSGALEGLGEHPRIELNFALAAKEASGLIALIDPEIAARQKDWGPLALEGQGRGDSSGIELEQTARIAGAEASLRGDLGLTAGAPVNVSFRLGADDPAQLLRLFGLESPEPLGRLQAQIDATGNAEAADVTAEIALGGGRFSVAGKLAHLAAEPAYDLVIEVEQPRFNDLLRTFAAGYRPAAGARLGAFSAKAKVAGDAQVLKLSDVVLSLGEMRLAGAVVIDAGARTAEIKLEAGQVDLDMLLPARSAAPAGGSGTAVPDVAQLLPADRRVRIDATAQELVWRGGHVRNVEIRLALANGALSVDRLAARLPGETDFDLSARATRPGEIGLSGQLELTSAHPRALLEWLGLEANLPADRLRRLRLTSAVIGDVKQLSLSGLTSSVDDSQITGDVAVAFGARPRLDLDLTLDRVDIDAYLPAPAASAKATKASAGAGPGDLLRMLAPLAAYDGSVKFALGEARFRSEDIRGLTLALRLADGGLVLERLEVGDIAGAHMTADGSIERLGGNPAFHINHALRADEAAGLARLAGLGPAVSDASMGAISIEGRASGDSERVRIDEQARVAGARLSLFADLGLVAGTPVAAEGKLEVTEPARFARLFGYVLSGPASPIVLDLKAKGTAEAADLNASVHNDEAEATLQGRLALAGAPKLDGALKGALHDSRPLLAAVGLQLGRDAAGLLNSLQFACALVVDPNRLVLDRLKGGVGGSEISDGRIVVPLGTAAGYEVALRFARLDLEPLLSAFAGKETPQQPHHQAAPAPGFALPGEVQLDLGLDVGVLAWRERTLRNLAVKARLAQGLLSLSRVAADLPGKGRASFAGTLAARDGQPALEGKITGDVANLKTLLDWAGLEPSAVSKDRLGRATFAAALQARPDRVQLDDLGLALDQSRIAGRLEARLGNRPRITADLSLDQIEVDGYLPAAATNAAPRQNTTEEAVLAPLATFDGELALAVGRLSFAGYRLEKLQMRSTLDAGTLRLSRLEVGDFLGARASGEAIVRQLAGSPTYDLHYQAAVPDTGPLFALAELTPPIAPREIGPLRVEGRASGGLKQVSIEAKAEALDAALAVEGEVSLAPGSAVALTANLDAARSARLLRAVGLLPPDAGGPLAARLAVKGTMVEATIDGSLGYAGGDVDMKGKLTGLDRRPEYNLALQARHPHPYELIKAVNKGYEPQGGRDLGPLRLAGMITGGTDGLALTGLDAAVDKSRLTGDVRVHLKGPRPRVVARLGSDGLDLRPLLPRETAASAKKGEQRRTGDRVFSDEPLPFERLGAFDADVELQARRLLMPRLALHEAKLSLRLADGQLTVEPVSAQVGGGRLAGRFAVTPARGGGAVLATTANVEQLDLQTMARELGAEKVLEGKLDAHVDLKGRGASVAAIMAGLDGRTNLVVGRGRIDSRYLDLIGADLADNPLRFLSPGGGHTEVNCMVSRFEVKQGLADSKAMVLDTSRMTVVGEGRINLRNEALDIRIEPTPKSGAGTDVGARLGLSLGGLARPFKLGGTLAHPAVAIDAAGAALVIGKAVGGAALFGPAGVAAALVTNTDRSGNACLKAIEAAERGVAPPPAPSKSVVPPAPQRQRDQDVTAPVKRTLDDLKGTLKGILGR